MITQSHSAWILSLFFFVLFNVMFQFWMYHMWTGEGNAFLWGVCTVAMPVVSFLGIYSACLFLRRNKEMIPPLKQMIVPIWGVLLGLGNLICLGYGLFFIGMIVFCFLRIAFKYMCEILAILFGFRPRRSMKKYE